MQVAFFITKRHTIRRQERLRVLTRMTSHQSSLDSPRPQLHRNADCRVQWSEWITLDGTNGHNITTESMRTLSNSYSDNGVFDAEQARVHTMASMHTNGGANQFGEQPGPRTPQVSGSALSKKVQVFWMITLIWG